MRYTTKIKRKGAGKYTWAFNPPDDVQKAGILCRQSFQDGRTARAVIPKLIDKVDAYRRGEIAAESLPTDCTVLQLTSSYLSTAKFNSLSGATREAYSGGLGNISNTPYKSGTVGSLKVQQITSQMAAEIYELWTKKGAAWANKHKRLWGVLLSYAISLDIVPRNPMTKVGTLSHTPQSIVWQSEQVQKFLEVAFSDFRYRNIGIITLLCYEWGQRPVDIEHLKWDNIDFESKTVTIKQRKRGATVTLPLDPELELTLLKQKEDYDFQEYVAPRFRKQDSAYRPYTSSTLTPLVKEILLKAGLPSDLQVGALRKSAIMEMVEAGVDSTQLMSVTGHKDIKSLNPYLKHTRKAASAALGQRKNNR